MIPVSKKKLIVVSDIHGNLPDFLYFLNLWLRDKENHIVFLGDLIHSDSLDTDGSIEILELVREYIDYDTFHVLLGNHELSQILDEDAYRYGVNQVEEFKLLVESKYIFDYKVKYDELIELLKKFKPAISTENGFFLIHSGVHEDYLNSLISGDINLLSSVDYDGLTDFEKEVLTEIIWARPYQDYSEDVIDDVCDLYDCRFMISGHTNYNGCHVFGNQLIFDSSYCTEHKHYLELDLNKYYENILDVLKDLNRIN